MNRRLWLLLPALALSGCLNEPADPIEIAALERAARDPCNETRDADFEGGRGERFQRYARTLAARASVPPEEVSVAIVKGTPEAAPRGVAAAEIACGSNDGRPPYLITLYRDALAGRPLQTAFRTVAHEMQHVVQIRRDLLPCGPRAGTREHYEREAEAIAERLVPACG